MAYNCLDLAHEFTSAQMKNVGEPLDFPFFELLEVPALDRLLWISIYLNIVQKCMKMSFTVDYKS